MITITLPWPDSDLSPNGRKHWRVTSKAKAKYKARCEWRFMCLAPHATHDTFPAGDIPLTLTFHKPSRRHMDADGLLSRMKSGLDGVAKALGIDDVRFRPITVNVADEPIKGGQVVVVLG
jgi:hypothetical protein